MEHYNSFVLTKENSVIYREGNRRDEQPPRCRRRNLRDGGQTPAVLVSASGGSGCGTCRNLRPRSMVGLGLGDLSQRGVVATCNFFLACFLNKKNFGSL
jgi:hypothetical protein